MKEGVFWVIGHSKEGLRAGAFELITEFDRDAAHRDVWERLRRNRPELCPYDYEFYPRGRIWLQDGIPIVFLNPVLEIPAVIERVKQAFELIDEVDIRSDGFKQRQRL